MSLPPYSSFRCGDLRFLCSFDHADRVTTISRSANIKLAYTCMSFKHAEAYVINHSYLLLLVLLEISNCFKPRSYKTLFLEDPFNLTPCLAHWFTYNFLSEIRYFIAVYILFVLLWHQTSKKYHYWCEINNKISRIKNSMYWSCPVASYMHLNVTSLQNPAPYTWGCIQHKFS